MVPGELQARLARLPDEPGCYLFRDAGGAVLYVGKADQLRQRVRSYFHESASHTPRILAMVQRVAGVEVVTTRTPVEALLLENTLIKRHRPYYNVRLRDDKQYPYICLKLDEPFPRPIVVRRVKRDGNRYFGPYASAWAMRQALRVIKAVFLLRTCSRRIAEGDRQRVCLDYHLGLCSAPCAGLIDRAAYLRAVDEAASFLRGRAEETVRLLRERMHAAAEGLNFESAARIRDLLHGIERATERQKVVSTDLADRDLVGLVVDEVQACVAVVQVRGGRVIGEEHFFLDGAAPGDEGEALRRFLEHHYQRPEMSPEDLPREILASHDPGDLSTLAQALREAAGRKVVVLVPLRGEKRRLVELALANARVQMTERKNRAAADRERAEEAVLELQEALGLASAPYRIECYDISHTQGQATVGAMVVFESGLPDRGSYRRFQIKSVRGPDDFESLREMLRRRLRRGIEGDVRFAQLPDLLVIDGGKGQLQAALDVETELGVEIPAIGLAKRLEEVFIPGRSDSLLLPRASPALFLLQRIRDETHRFGVTYHRRLRGRSQTRSTLDAIPGIGPARRRALLKQFGSVDKIKQASVEELAEAPGMNRAVAERLHHAFHGASESGAQP